MLSFTENFTTFGPNAEKTEYLLEFEIAYSERRSLGDYIQHLFYGLNPIKLDDLDESLLNR